MIPPFSFSEFVQGPWRDFPLDSLWVVLTGFFVCASAGLCGTYLILRRMALVGDAISHSVLPGLAVAFMIAGSRGVVPMVLGGIAAGVLTVALVELIHRSSRVKPDAAIGIVFSAFFAVGVILVTAFADHVDLDADCVLYGEIDLVPIFEPVVLGGLDLGPRPMVQMGVVLLLLAGLILTYYKELLVTSFDAGLAASLGISPRKFQIGLTLAVSIVVVSAFEAVGAILVIAMLIFPGATAKLLSDRLPVILGLGVVFAAVYALLGYHVAVWLNTLTAGAMTVVALGVFLVVWTVSPRRSWVLRVRHRLA